jgi:leader peptidase (prepilin peptidase) / N-methyltransferase
VTIAVLGAALLGVVAGWFARRLVQAESGTPLHPAIAAGATGLLCAAATWRFGAAWDLPVYLYFAVVSVPLVVIDLRTHRLPNVLTLSAYPIVLSGLIVPALAYGDWTRLGWALAGGAVVLALFALLHLINPAGMGMGDVKLAGPMGALLGWISWSVVLVGTFLGFALGAIVGIALIIARRAGRKSAIPFGPFMLAGAWIAILASDAIERLGVLP